MIFSGSRWNLRGARDTRGVFFFPINPLKSYVSQDYGLEFCTGLADERFLCSDWLCVRHFILIGCSKVVFDLIGCMKLVFSLIGCMEDSTSFWLVVAGCTTIPSKAITTALFWTTMLLSSEFAISDIFYTLKFTMYYFSPASRVIYFLFGCFRFRENVWDAHSRTGTLSQRTGRNGIQGPDIIP